MITTEKIKNIIVTDAIIMNTKTPTIPDLTKFSAQALKDALAKVESKKEEDRQAYKKLVEEAVPQAVFTLCAASEMISKAKTETFRFFENLLRLKGEVYGVKETQQSHTFSVEGAEITIGYRVNESWDDTVNTGIAKVENFIRSLARDDNSASLVKVVFNLLKKDAKGNLKSSRVLELQKLTKEFNNEEFTDGVKIISDSYKPVKSVWFVEGSTIDKNGVKSKIPLSISAAEFTAGYAFDFFNEEKKDNE